MKGFLAYSKAKMQQKNVPARRWNFAGALQISATTKIPAADEVVAGFSKYFRPERIRVVLLSPNSRGNHLPQGIWTALTSKLNLIPEVEIVTVDASKKNANGLIYSDFFDFT
ncbi:hypothetical protein [Dongia sp.]|uniref:hypothetical protein n=1 Tax=Dongia sp. TaxID=1977262 RepID=UPI0035B289D9